MKYAARSLGAAAIALSLGAGAADAQENENILIPDTDAPAAAALSINSAEAIEAVRELNQACTIYSNVLTAFDEIHIHEENDTPHNELMETGLQTALLTYYFNQADRNVTVQLGQNTTFGISRESDLDIEPSMMGDMDHVGTVTLSDGAQWRFENAPTDMDSYEEHCAYYQPAIQVLAANSDLTAGQYYEAILNGIIRETRDPHSAFVGPERFQAMNEATSEPFVGVGVQIDETDDGYLRIINPIAGTGGDAAGLRSEDVITAVDGQDIQEMSMEDAVSIIRGPIGSTVVLTIQREGQEPFDVSIVRGEVTQQNVTAEMVGDTLHIQIRTFDEDVYEDFFAALRNGMAEWAGNTGTNLEKLVIDVRGNTGGRLDQVLLIIDHLIHSDSEEPHQIMGTGRSPEDLSERHFDGQFLPNVFPQFRISVLTDEGSASASEILAGALVDEGQSIVGRRSYGKGSVQTVIPLNAVGERIIYRHQLPVAMQMRVTTSAFFPGNSVLSNQGSGINPTVEVRYNDFRDEFHESARHEGDNETALLPAGQTRESILPANVCTLNEAFAGVVSEEQLMNLSTEFTIMVFENRLGERPAAFWAQAVEMPEFNEARQGYREYIENFTQMLPVPQGEGDELTYTLSRVMDADRLCAQHDLDGVQEIAYQGVPITTITPYGIAPEADAEEIEPDTVTPSAPSAPTMRIP